VWRPNARSTLQAAELGGDEVNEAMSLLQQHFGDVLQIQCSGMGAYTPRKSMPRFNPCSGRPFVQILNVGDHWICVSNKFGWNTHDVFVFDSLYSAVSQQTITQVTSLLRDDDETDEIVMHVRDFKQQSQGTRICGFYAVAAAFACCLNRDPTGMVYDETLLPEHFRRCISRSEVALFPGIATDSLNGTISTVSKNHCFCQHPTSGEIMLKCTTCHNRYHQSCVQVYQSAMKSLNDPWLGP